MPNSTTANHRVVFFGSSAASSQVLEDLLDFDAIDLVAVVTQPTKAQSHTHQRTSKVTQLAQNHSIPLFTPHKLAEITHELADLNPTFGVLFAYGKILPKETINLFPRGIVNIHPSLLPKHRGPAPLENTILSGDTEAGTSIMLITSEMDAGPILAQKSFAIPNTISKQELWEQLVVSSRDLLIPTLTSYMADKITPQAQSTSIEPTYSHIIKKGDGDINPHTTNAAALTRMVRAYAGWPGVRLPVLTRETVQPLTLHEIKLIEEVESQTVRLECNNKRLMLHLRNGTVEILRAQLPNKSIVTGRDLCNAGSIRLA